MKALLMVLLCSWIHVEQVLAYDLTLHLIPAPSPTNWGSPGKLTRSALKNQIIKYKGGKRHSIGHLFVELNCPNTSILTGSTSISDTEERQAIFVRGYGLGVVLKNYAGKLDDPSETRKDIDSLQSTGRSTFLRFLISESTCTRLVDYLDEYQHRGYHRIYAGLNARPLDGESAGCTAFGMSFLELAGLQVAEFEQAWIHALIMPRKLVGGPTTGNRVSFMKALTDFKTPWDSDLSNGGIPLKFWDPEKMVNWTKIAAWQLESGETRPFPWPARSTWANRSIGIEFDTRIVPTPTGPIFRVPPPGANQTGH